MRTVAEIRDRLLEDIRFAVRRPTLRCGTNAEAAGMLLLHLLEALCFIDNREKDWAAVRASYAESCRWLRGPLPFPAYVNELASIYAEMAFELGYFRPGRLLTETEMSRLAGEVSRPGFRRRDRAASELRALFGPPTHEVVGGPTMVACYGCARAGVRWVYFDLVRRLPGAEHGLPEPLVRDYRDGVDNRMRLLPVGRRWVAGLHESVEPCP